MAEKVEEKKVECKRNNGNVKDYIIKSNNGKKKNEQVKPEKVSPVIKYTKEEKFVEDENSFRILSDNDEEDE